MGPELDDTIIDAELVEPAPGKDLALTERHVDVIPDNPYAGFDYTRLTVILPPPMSSLEKLMAFVSLPKWTWHKWVFDVSDAVHDGDVDAVQTLVDLGLRKGFK